MVNLGYSAALHAGIYHTLLVPIVLLIALFSRFGYKFNKHLVTYLLTSSSTSFSTLAAMTVAVTLLAVFVIVAAYCSATAACTIAGSDYTDIVGARMLSVGFLVCLLLFDTS